MNLLLLILLHLAAILGALLLLRIKAPAAALIGSMFGVVIFFVVTPSRWHTPHSCTSSPRSSAA